MRPTKLTETDQNSTDAYVNLHCMSGGHPAVDAISADDNLWGDASAIHELQGCLVWCANVIMSKVSVACCRIKWKAPTHAQDKTLPIL